MKQWLKNTWLIPVLGIIGTFLIFVFRPYILNWISVLVLFWTFLAIVGYLTEIYRQGRVLLRPYLRLQYYNPTKKDKKDKYYNDIGILQLVNIGKGLATDIEFKNLIFGGGTRNFQIKKIPAMSANNGATTICLKQIEPDFKNIKKENVTRTMIIDILKDNSNKHYEIIATYEDLEKTKFKVIFMADDEYNDGFRIIYQEKI